MLHEGGEVGAGAVEAADEQRREAVAVGRHPLRLAEGLPDEPAGPQREPPGHPGIGGDGLAHLADDELGVTGVLEHAR